MYEEKASFDVLKGTVPEFYSDVTFALIVDGEEQKDIPNQEDNYAVEVKCDKGKGIWKQELWGLELTEIKEKKVRCNIEFTTLKQNKTIDFDYTGKEEAISLPKGNYKLEVWGAQGGTDNNTKEIGGLGGYSVGTYNIEENGILYINVGGQGESGSEKGQEDKIYKGGYNGGGNGIIASTNVRTDKMLVSGGGGATHIALVTGLLSTLESKQEYILIVAGGGGGNGGIAHNNPVSGGSGGGTMGSKGINPVNTGTEYMGTGGTQDNGGSDYTFPSVEEGQGKFGQGGSAVKDPANDGKYSDGNGGGGGFYGGGGSSRFHAGAGGGSGYIGNERLTNKEMWCYNCEISEETNLKTSTTTETSAEAKSNTPKQGHGYAKITYLGQ